MNNENNENQIDDIVSMLDNFMKQGGGHMNIDANQAQQDVQIQTSQCSECSTGKWSTACAVPTLEQGMDKE